MKKLIIPLLAIVSLLAITPSCSSNTAEQAKSEINVSSFNSSMGENPDNLSQQIFSYSVYLSNNGATDITIRSIEPILTTSFNSKAIGNNYSVVVENTMAPGASLEVSGEITFDTTGMSKEQITAMEPFLSGAKVNMDKVLTLRG